MLLCGYFREAAILHMASCADPPRARSSQNVGKRSTMYPHASCLSAAPRSRRPSASRSFEQQTTSLLHEQHASGCERVARQRSRPRSRSGGEKIRHATASFRAVGKTTRSCLSRAIFSPGISCDRRSRSIAPSAYDIEPEEPRLPPRSSTRRNARRVGSNELASAARAGIAAGFALLGAVRSFGGEKRMFGLGEKVHGLIAGRTRSSRITPA